MSRRLLAFGVPLQAFVDTLGVERPGNTECSGERPAPLGLGQTVRHGVQPGTPARQPPTFVDDQPTVRRDHSQQLADQGPLTATDTSANRGFPVMLEVGSRRRTLNHS